MSRHLQELTGKWQNTDMARLYLNSHTSDFGTISAIHPLLIPSRDALDAIESYGWHSVRRSPGSVSNWDQEGKEHVAYHRFGNADGIEPLVLVREFHDFKEPYVEVSEEYRLFHNLYPDTKHQSYAKFDESGQETVVVKLQSDCAMFRVQEVREYLAVREMHLLIQFDIHEQSQHSLSELSLAKDEKHHHDEEQNWKLRYTELERQDYFAAARLIGKRLLVPVEKRHSGFRGFSEPTNCYADFLIGYDDQGGEIKSTCDPARLPLYNTNPDFFTAVSFRKDVLERYHSQPSKFSVSDGLLSCGNLWRLPFDDDHDDRVCAWLGDLGTILPYKEQQHWLAHNFLPSDIGVSKTFFDRQFAAEWAESHRPEHQFRELYRQLNETCEKRMGWLFLKPLHEQDAHRLSTLRVPASAEQPAVDEQLQNLATILIDSLNMSKLQNLIPPAERPADDGSINLLDALFRAKSIDDYQPHIALLRTIQGLRSTSSAHRKGSKYDRLASKVGMKEQGPRRVVANLIEQGNGLLRFLIAVVESGTLVQ
ncbi:MAG: hypothetical protein OXG24_06450 [Gammaproteobacteria bacterium]|nr:hypothetical protein [Gammaproteobacteria bacterium]